MILNGCGVDLVELDFSRGECLVELALGDIGWILSVAPRVRATHAGFKVELWVILLVFHIDERGSLEGLIEGVGHYNGDGLMVVEHCVVLQQRENAAGGRIDPGLAALR
jgi:hypothetical protein